jgi:hypothetical protein
MPINITSGSTVQFTVVFTDASSAVVVPSSATMTVTYPLSSASLTMATCAIGMAANGQFFTASWGSGVAALGITSLSVSAPGLATPLAGTLRVIS